MLNCAEQVQIQKWKTHALPDEGREETGIPGEKPSTMSFRKCHMLKPENSSPDLNPLSALVAGACWQS